MPRTNLTLAFAAVLACAAVHCRADASAPKLDSEGRTIAVVNTQTLVSQSNICLAVNAVSKNLTSCDFKVSQSTPKAPAKIRAEVSEPVVVIVVDNADDPSLLVSVDDRWAVVNLRRCVRPGTSAQNDAAFEARCRKQVMRGISAVCGGFCSTYHGNILDVLNPQQLDTRQEFVPFDKIMLMDWYLREYVKQNAAK